MTTDNRNYYEGTNPLARIYAAQARRNNAVKNALAARTAMVGELLPLPDGYRPGQTPAATLNGYGLGSEGVLLCPTSQGSVEGDWRRDLAPDEMLATVEVVEERCAAITETLHAYARKCAVVSAERAAAAGPVIALLSGPAAAASMLRSLAAKIEQS